MMAPFTAAVAPSKLLLRPREDNAVIFRSENDIEILGLFSDRVSSNGISPESVFNMLLSSEAVSITPLCKH